MITSASCALEGFGIFEAGTRLGDMAEGLTMIALVGQRNVTSDGA